MNDRICLVGENSIEYVEQLIKIWNSGNCAVLIDYRIPIISARRMVEESHCIKCIMDSRLREQWNCVEQDIPCEFFDSCSDVIQELPTRVFAAFTANYSTEEALVLFSSGTTGKSKGIILSHNAINTNADMIASCMKLKPTDSFLIVKILVHSSTVIGELLVSLKTQTRCYVGRNSLSVSSLITGATARKVTIMCINPSLMKLITEYLELYKPKGVTFRKIYISGAVLQLRDLRKIMGLLYNCEIFNAYGLTEAGPRVAMQMKGSEVGSVGKPIGNVKIKIEEINEFASDNRKIGRIYVKTPTAYMGYVNRPIYDAEWINTKDIGYWGDSGDLFVIGRADDVIIKSGCNVFPDTIEEIVLEYPEVSECFVFGYPHDLYGQKIICLYSLKDVFDNRSYEKDIRRICNQHLLQHEIPDTFLHVDSIKRNVNGKVDRKLNIQQYEEIIKKNESD